MKASKIISDAILGNDSRVINVNSRSYAVFPPTINRMAGACSELSEIDMDECSNIKDILLLCKNSKSYSRALSYFIKGDLSLSDELSEGTYEEVVDGLCVCFEMISPQVFMKAASLTKSVNEMAAKQK